MPVKAKVKAKVKVRPKKKTAEPRSILDLLLSFDQVIKKKNPRLTIIGVDEVGRGCLAGPVVAAAAVLPEIELGSDLANALFHLNDSKKLTPALRNNLCAVIKEHAYYAVASASVEEIDEINILQASYLAMKRAILELSNLFSWDEKSILVLVDGKQAIPRVKYRQISVIKGDGLSASVAAASVVAKVHRDKLMEELAHSYPMYDWHSNKGYACASHRQAIMEHGTSLWHRRSFMKNMVDVSDEDE